MSIVAEWTWISSVGVENIEIGEFYEILDNTVRMLRSNSAKNLPGALFSQVSSVLTYIYENNMLHEHFHNLFGEICQSFFDHIILYCDTSGTSRELTIDCLSKLSCQSRSVVLELFFSRINHVSSAVRCIHSGKHTNDSNTLMIVQLLIYVFPLVTWSQV